MQETCTMATIISILNQKGGVAKTITVAHLAVALGRKGKTVLCVDMDPQANLSVVLGNLEYGQKPRTTIYEVLRPGSKQSLGVNYLDTREKNVKLCYGSLNMAGLERELISNMSLDPSRVLLKKIDDHIREEFDFVLIDCPPSLSQLTTNALGASDYFIIPIASGDSLALEGVEQLTLTIEAVQDQLNPNLELLGVLLTRYDARLNIAKAISNEVEQIFGTKNLFKVLIRNNTLIEQATHAKKTVFELDSRAPGAQDYTKLSAEVIRRSEARAQALTTDPDDILDLQEAPDGQAIARA